jgi:hypothetical protein
MVGGLPVYRVNGRLFASLTPEGQVVLHLDPEAIRNSLPRCTITVARLPEDDAPCVAVPLDQVNGMELNNLVYRSWLNQAPAELAAAAVGAVKGEAPEGPDALPRAIGKPVAREVGVGRVRYVGGASAWRWWWSARYCRMAPSKVVVAVDFFPLAKDEPA